MLKKSKSVFLLLALLALTCQPLLAADTCGLAQEIAGKAAKKFSSDQSAGLKLFIKAQQLCPEDASLNYNLGVAYYQYGRLADAQQSLETAVKIDDRRASWLNNLAAVMLERGTDAGQTLGYAKKAAQLDKNTAAIQTTLVQAELASGNLDEAMTTAQNAQQKWPSDKSVLSAYEMALDAALAHNLELIQQGQAQAGLDGLKGMSDVPQAARAYILALNSLGRTEDALAAGLQAKQKFPGDRAISDAVEDVADVMVQSLYADYQAGKGGSAVAQARDMAKKYPAVVAFQVTSDKLLEAFLAEAVEIEAPKSIARSQPRAGGGRADALLAGLSTNRATTQTDLTLKVDVDVNIPRGAIKRPYAVAVVIGNQNYARQNRGVGDVRWAGRDARVMQKYLVEVLGYDPKNIVYATDTTSGDLRNIFGSKDNPRGKLYNMVRKGESEVFVYYVGHGAPGPDGRSAYLVPVDAEADFIVNNGYPLDLFYQVMRDLPAKSKTVVLDACFSGDSPAGALFKNISPAMVRNVRAIQDVENSVIFSSADKDQVSTWYNAKRHSMFTYFFLKGLGGEADADRNKSITAGEMQAYLGKEVPYWAQREANRSQTPLMTGKAESVMVELR